MRFSSGKAMAWAVDMCGLRVGLMGDTMFAMVATKASCSWAPLTSRPAGTASADLLAGKLGYRNRAVGGGAMAETVGLLRGHRAWSMTPSQCELNSIRATRESTDWPKGGVV